MRHLQAVRLFQGVIQEVNPAKYTYVVATQNRMYEGVTSLDRGTGADGQGDYNLYEKGASVWLLKPSSRKVPFIVGSATVAPSGEDRDCRMNRPVVSEGDKVLMGGGGSPHVILRRGGVLEFGEGEGSKTMYLPVEDLIRNFTRGWSVFTAGGELDFGNRVTDDTHGTDKTPVELKLDVKEFTDEDPMISLRMGRVKDLNEDRTVTGDAGDIVTYLEVNKRCKVWIDKQGNLQTYTFGGRVSSHEGAVIESTAASWFRDVRWLLREELGSRFTNIARTDTLTVGQSREVSIGGNEKRIIQGSQILESGPRTDTVQGAHTRTVAGTESATIVGHHQVVVGGELLHMSGEGSHEVVGGKKTIFIANASADDQGLGVVIAVGETEIHGLTGAVRLKTAFGLATIDLDITGRITINSTKGVAKVEVNSTGIRIKTKAGEVSLDNAGTVALGPEGRGCVLTTLTQPTCYVTGTPFKGSTGVVAGGIPGVTPLTSTFTDAP